MENEEERNRHEGVTKGRGVGGNVETERRIEI